MNARHPTAQEIELFVIGAEDEIDFSEIEQHLRGCDLCAETLTSEARLEAKLSEIAVRAEYCPGCQSVATAVRCDHCGVARSPGGFTVERVLVSSGHGRVYLAHNVEGQRVALKELVFTQIPNTQTLVAFEREAKLLKELDHPGVPRFIASFTEGDGVHTRLYLAQEYVDGSSLLARMSTHRFTEIEVIEIARRVLDILEYLHSLEPRVIHRDVKPANILMRKDGSVVLVDFGAARDFSLTGGSTLVGTFGYMPPEQLVGMADASSDLYALGASLAHLVSRRPPWQLSLGSRSLDGLRVSAHLRRFVSKLTATDPGDRYQSAREAKEALALEKAGHRTVVIGALAAVALATIALTWVVAKTQPSGVAVPPRVEAQKLAPPAKAHALMRLSPLGAGSFATADNHTFAIAHDDPSVVWKRRGTQWFGRHRSPTRGAAIVAEPRIIPTGPLPARTRPPHVYLIGGTDAAGVPVKTVERCEVDLSSCEIVSEMNTARSDHTATLLGDGRILVIGGASLEAAQTAEIYTPARREWTSHVLMQPHYGHTATLLDDGSVFMMGPSAELFDPNADRLRAVVQPTRERIHHAAVLLPGDRVLITGGTSPDRTFDVGRSVEIYEGGAWSKGPDAPRLRSRSQGFVDGGDVYIVGGIGPDGATISAVDVLHSGQWRFMVLADAGRIDFHAMRTSGGVALIGGEHVAPDGGRIAARDGWVSAGLASSLPVVSPRADEARDRGSRREPSNDVKALLAKGKKALIEGKVSLAEDLLTQCVQVDRSIAECHRLLGVLYAQKDDTYRSIKHYKRYVELKPDAPDAPRVNRMIREVEGSTR